MVGIQKIFLLLHWTNWLYYSLYLFLFTVPYDISVQQYEVNTDPAAFLQIGKIEKIYIEMTELEWRLTPMFSGKTAQNYMHKYVPWLF